MSDNGVHQAGATRAIELRDGSLVRYSVYGAGPALAFCNGLCLNTALWTPFIEFFADRFRVVVWDYPGHGESDTPEDLSELNINGLTGILRRLFAQEGINKATLIGHSLGAQLIFRYAHERPSHVTALVPIAGTPNNPMEFLGPVAALAQPLARATTALEAHSGLLTPLWRSLASTPAFLQVARRFASNPRLTSEEAFLPYFHSLSEVDLRIFFHLLREATLDQTEVPLSEINQPTLAIYGERDPLAPHIIARSLVHRLPHAELFTVRRGTHLAMLDGQRAVLLRMEKFLRERVHGPQVVERPYQETAP